MSTTSPRRGPRGRRLYEAACLCAIALACLPIARAPVIADDLTVVARAIPILQAGSFWDLFSFRTTDNINYQHFLPVAGAFEATQTWVAIEVGRLTPLSVSNVWGLARVFWIVVIVVAAVALARSWRRVWPGLSSERAPREDLYLLASTGFIVCATLQVHATWSLDPVISINVYAWPSVALSLAYLSIIGRILISAQPRRWLVVLATVVGCIAVLAYELSVGAAAGAGAAVLVVTYLERRLVVPWIDLVRRVLRLAPAVLLPLVVLVAGLILRPESTDVYEGVQPRLGVDAVGTWVTGLLGALPLGSWPRGVVAYGVPSFSSKSVAVAVVGLVALLLVVGRSRGWEHRPVAAPDAAAPDAAAPASGSSPWTTRRRAWVVPFSALVTYWFVGTALHAITIKQQEEIDYTIGNVYLFYSIGLVVVSLAVQAVVTSSARRWGGRVILVLALPGLLAGAYQAAYNTQLTSSVRAAQNYNYGILASATEQVPEAKRCAAWEQFAETDLPFYFEDWVSEAFDRYEQEYDQSFCTSDVNGRALSGLSHRERVNPQVSFWWVTTPAAVLRVSRHPGTVGTFFFTLTVDSAPCGEPASIVVTGPAETVRVSLDQASPAATVPLTLPAGVESAEVRLETDATVCRVPNDPRSLLFRVFSPTVTGYLE